MIRYEVAVDVPEEAAEAFEAYMRRKHLPEILDTGCFSAIRFQRASATRFRSSYEAPARADLQRYLDEHTARFRADFLAHFPEGCAVAREVWEDVEDWARPVGYDVILDSE